MQENGIGYIKYQLILTGSYCSIVQYDTFR